jgi:UDP-N-acetylglucosamine 2-epimerase (non-hydrolysing)
MAPLILSLKKQSSLDVKVVVTAQHREMLDQVLRVFGISPDIDLNIMTPNQSLSHLTSRLISSLDLTISEIKPDIILAQGDTTTVMASALTSFYRNIPFGHVEAGLRTRDLKNPFPEELNRVVVGRIAKWHFAPTESARNNLLDEGTSDTDIYVTGNTVIDALKLVDEVTDCIVAKSASTMKKILVTTHRRESFGEPFERICKALLAILDRNKDVEILYPVHPNPKIKESAYRFFAGHPRILLCDPLDYVPFVAAMKSSYLIISDSGGIQEEAPALGKPVLVLREETERPEAVSEGVVKLVGTSSEKIIEECQILLDDHVAYSYMARGVSPYGDGRASQRIIDVLVRYLMMKE